MKKYFNFLCLLIIIVGLDSCSEPQKAEFLLEEKIVRDYLKVNLKDPDSYQSIEWKTQEIKDEIVFNKFLGKEYIGCYAIQNRFRARNSFGGYNISTMVFIIRDKVLINVMDWD